MKETKVMRLTIASTIEVSGTNSLAVVNTGTKLCANENHCTGGSYAASVPVSKFCETIESRMLVRAIGLSIRSIDVAQFLSQTSTCEVEIVPMSFGVFSLIKGFQVQR